MSIIVDFNLTVRTNSYFIKVVHYGTMHSQNSSLSQHCISHSNLVIVLLEYFKDHGRNARIQLNDFPWVRYPATYTGKGKS